jgi:hypothetical protein
MTTAAKTYIDKKRIPSFFGAGVFTQGGGGMLEEGASMIVFGVLIGAFIGLVLGFILSNFARFFAYMSGRHVGTAAWVIASMVVGAVVCGYIASLDKGD